MIVPDPEDLQELVQDLHRRAAPWLPTGLGSRLDWGPALRQPCALVSTGRLRGIVEHSPGDFVVRVAAGTPLEELQAELARHRQWLAVDPPPAAGPPWAEGDADGEGSIGGLVARGLSGGYRQRYLGIRDQLIGIRVLRADGVPARAGGKVVKNVAGYDLMRLFTGSWGSLGLITELTLRTMPQPAERAGLLLRGPAAALVARVGSLLHSGLSPERLDLWSAPLAAAAGLPQEPHLLVALAGVSPSGLREQITAAGSGDPTLQARRCGADELGALLAAAGPQRPQAGQADPSAWLLRLAVTPSLCARLLDEPSLAALPLTLAAGSGLGMAWAPAHHLQTARVVALRRRCGELGGHLTVLRQPQPPAGGGVPGSPAAERLSAWEDAPSRALIEAVKARFDPLAQLAPGRLPGVACPKEPGASRG